MASQARPGQFLMIRTSDSCIPLWRRAFSIARVYPESAELEILVLKVGQGSRQLAEFKSGDTLDVLGPLGRSFDLERAKNRNALLVGGGIGIAPLLFLADRLASLAQSITLLYGARNAQQLVPLKELAAHAEIITEDGSAGRKGRVTDLLRQHLNTNTTHPLIYACGPNAMLHQVMFLAHAFGVDCQVSLETRMACGIGVCMGCPVPRRKPTSNYYYACVDGPVFNAEEIQIEEDHG